jgi:hypothetical protein
MRTDARRFIVLSCIILAAAAVCGCLYSSGSFAGPSVVAVTIGPSASPTSTPVPTGEYTPTLTPVPTVEYTPSPQPFYSAETAIASPTPPPDEQWYDENFSWTYNNVQWNFNVQISQSIYDFYKYDSDHTSENFSGYALTSEDKSFLQDVTTKLKVNGASYGYSDYDNAMNVLTFVQSIPYAEDTANPEYTKYPIETLKDDQGDCKDKAILAAAMLHEMGYDVVLLQYQQHMAVGIDINASGTYFEYDGARYYYAETTSVNWDIGDMPDALDGQTPIVLPL